MRKLILGDGLLGSEIYRQSGWDYISRKRDNIDFREPGTYENYLKEFDVIVNCIGHVDVYSDDRQTHWDVNYKAVSDLVDLCNENCAKLVHISTDFVYSNSVENASEKDVPVHNRNWYGYTKLLSDAHIQLKSVGYLLIRTSYKPKPFPYEKAWTSQRGNFDYVDKIATIIIKLIDDDLCGVYNVGTESKTMFELACRTRESVEPLDKLYHDSMPTNITMNLGKLTNVKE
jgi:dTDP-4-dehydrorhamnose reductase